MKTPKSHLDIYKALRALSTERPVFGSEADFQFALAWKIKELHPKAEIRLEEYYDDGSGDGKNRYIDLVVEYGGEIIPIELKYKTAEFYGEVNGRLYNLKPQGAIDIGGYLFTEDIRRIESYVGQKNSKLNRGYAILLTSEKGYWELDGVGKLYEDFALSDGKVLEKKLEWHLPPTKDKATHWTVKYPPIKLGEKYELAWQDWSNTPAGDFRFVAVEVRK
ncbi:MAG: hypothetical protein LBQ11_01115 [Candidatus Nomurabacteria bacterium]|jgi:hypothetical protein|nr:hypothetical protein [Candidatus Nomurabacteria bacterium]